MLSVSKRRIKRITAIPVSVIKISGKYCGDYAHEFIDRHVSLLTMTNIAWCVFFFFTRTNLRFFSAAARMTQRDLAQPIIHTKDQQLRCRMPIKITIETDCPPHCHPSSSRVNASVKHRQDYKLKNGSRRDKKCEIVNGQTSLPSWRSEYQDNISKIGHAIMRVKLHHAKRKAIPLQYQHCTTSN